MSDNLEPVMWPFAVMFFLAGLGLMVGGRRLERDARRAAGWPVTIGQLEQCEVIERPAIRSEDLSTWDLDLRYSYVVRGVTYHSTRYAFGYGGGSDDQKHRRLADTLKRSPQLSVRYDPARPSEAVLSTEAQTQITALGYFLLGMAFLSTLIALASRT